MKESKDIIITNELSDSVQKNIVFLNDTTAIAVFGDLLCLDQKYFEKNTPSLTDIDVACSLIVNHNTNYYTVLLILKIIKDR